MIQSDDVRRFFQARHPWMVRMLKSVFRGLYGELRDETVHNVITLAFENVLNCAVQGKIRTDDELTRFTRASLWQAIRHSRAGRQIHDKSLKQQAVHGDVWHKMPRHGIEIHELADASDSVPDVAALRIDFAAFLETLTLRNRLMVLDMIAGDRNGELAVKYAMTEGAVSQWRRKFVAQWRTFVEA